MRTRKQFLALLVLATGFQFAALAATFVWNQTSSGTYNWSTTTNWAGGIAPPVGGAADATVVLFPDSATLIAPGTRILATNDLGSGGTFNLNTLSIKGWFNNSSSAQAPATFGTASYILSGATLNFTGTNPTVYYHPSAYAAVTPNFYAGNPYVQINSNLNLSADTRFYTTDARTSTPGLWLNGTVSGPGRLTWDNQEYASGMVMALTGANTFTGGVTVGNTGSNRAVLQIASDASLGAVPGAVVADNLRLAGRIQPLNSGDLTINANRGITLFGGSGDGGGLSGPPGNTGWVIYGGKVTGAKSFGGVTSQLSGNVRLTGTTSDFGVPGTGATKYGIYTADVILEVVKLADEGQPSSIGSYGRNWFDGSGGTLRYIGTGDTTNRTFAGDKGINLDASGSGTINYTGLLDWSTGYGVTLTGVGSGVSSGTLNLIGVGTTLIHSLTKDGTGDWTISGTTNFALNTTGTTTVTNGTLTLDYRTVNAGKINTTALTLGGAGASATLAIRSNDTANTVQTVASAALTGKGGVNLNVTSGLGGQNATLVLGAITRNAGSTLDVNYTNLAGGTAAVTTTSANNAASILGGWAVVNGSDWATVGTANVNGGNNIVAYTGYFGALLTGGDVATANNDTLAVGQIQTAKSTVNSLKITDSGAAQSLDMGGFELTFTGTSGGLLYVGGTSGSYSIKNTGALNYIGGGTANEFLVSVKSLAKLDISARLIGNATAGSLTKSGGGTLVVSNGLNNYTGGTTVTAGTLKLGAANAIPSGGTFALGTGATFDLAGFSVTTGVIQGFGTITNSGGSDALLTIGNGTNNLTFAGVIQDGASNKINVTLNSNAPIQNLTGLNTYSGVTTVTAGSLYVANLADGGLASGLGKSGNAAANLILNGGTLGYIGTVNAATDRNMTLTTNGGGLSAAGGSTSTVVTFNGNITPSAVAGTRTLTLTGSSIGVLTGTVTDYDASNATALTKSGAGTWVLNATNGYSGTTNVTGGTLRATDGVGLPSGVSGSLLVLNGGVFETGTDFTRTLGTAAGNVQISGGISGFSANGTAPITVNIGSGSALTWSGNFNPGTLVLNEATANQNLTFANDVNLGAAVRAINVNAITGAATMSGLLTGVGGGGITKGGTGVLILTNNSNSFTGKITVTSGMLSFTSIGNVSGSASALGTPGSVADGTIDLNSNATPNPAITSALQYLGPTASTNRVINLAGTTGGAMIESSGSGPLTFTSNFTATGAGAKTLYLAGNTGGTIQGGIVNSGGGATSVVKAGTGVWELSGGINNTFTGGLTVRSGVLRAREASIPAGGGLTLNGSDPNNIASVWESDQDIVRGVNATPTAGNLLLTTTANYAPVGFSAKGNPLGISVNLGSGSALTLGSSGFLGNNQRLLLNEATADSTINFQNSMAIASAATSQTLNVVVNATGGNATAATMSGVLSDGTSTGKGTLTKDGPGILILSNASNTFTGGVTVYGGTLRVGVSGALPNSNVLTVNAGTLDLATANASATATSLTMGGGAAGTTSAVTTGTGILTLGGNVTYSGNTANDNGATISGNLSLTGIRTFTVNDSTAAANDLTVNAAISSTGAFGISKSGTGTLVLNANTTFSGAVTVSAGTLIMNGTNAYTGAVAVNGGTLVLNGNNPYTAATTISAGAELRVGGASGAIPSSSSIALSAPGTYGIGPVGSRLTIDNSTAAVSDRVGNGIGYTMNQDSEIRFIGNATNNVAETAGAIGTNDGRMTLTLSAGSGAGASITFASISHPSGQTFLVRGSNLGQGTPGTAGVANLLFADTTGVTGGSLVGGTGLANSSTQKVITFMVGDTSPTGFGSDLVTWDTTGKGVRALSLAANEYVTSIGGAAASGFDNVRLSGTTETVGTNKTINALLLAAGGGVNLSDGVLLTVTSGVITPVGDNVTISGGGTLGGIASGNTIYVNASRDLTISSRLVGTLYKGGPATLTVAGAVSGVGRMLGGTLRMGAPNVLPSGGTLAANGGDFLLDLNGYDQSIAGNSSWTSLVTNTSATYATLTTSSGLQGTITGALNIKFTGTGTLAINGGSANNAWTGWTQATTGTISMSGGHYFSPWSVFKLGDTSGSSGILNIVNGADMTIAGLTTVGGTANKVLSTTTGTRILTVRTLGSDWSYSGIIQDNSGTQFVGLTKAGVGKQTLSGVNAFTGATAVSGGTLELDYTTNDNQKIAPAAPLTLNGGTLRIVGNSYTQSVASTTVTAGDSGVAQASGGTQLNLNAFTRNVAGGTVDFSVAGGAASITTDTNNTSGILGGWATYGGTDWAKSVDAGAADTAITAYSGYNTNSNPALWGVTDNVSLSGNPAASLTTQSINSLRFNAAATLTILGQYLPGIGLQTLTLTSGGLLVTGSGAVNITGGGTLKGSNTRDLIVIQNSSADMTIDAVIENNTGATALTKSGTGRLLLNGNNLYTGVTYVNNGTVVLGHVNALGTTAGGTTIAVGGTLDLNGQAIPNEAFTVSGPGYNNAGALINSSATPVTVGGGVTLSGYDASIGGAGNITFNGIVTANGVASWVNFVKVGNGTVTLNGINTYTGQTLVNAGTLAVNGVISANSRGVLVAPGATLSGSGTIGGSMPFSISGGGLVSPGSSPGILTAGTVDATQGLDFAFEISQVGSPVYGSAIASGNDVLHLTGAYPFPFPLDSSNVISVYMNLVTLNSGDVFRGGFYTDNYGDFLTRVGNATFNYYVTGDGNGPLPFNGVNYYAFNSYYTMGAASLTSVAEPANFGAGIVNGNTMQWALSIPEPSALALLGIGALALLRRRRRG